MDNLEQRAGYVLLRARVQPKASADSLHRSEDGSLRLRITAPAVDGAANAAACAYLARLLRVPKSAVQVASGEKSREKAFRINGAEAQIIRAALPPQTIARSNDAHALCSD